MKDGERGRLIENYGKKEQKKWLDNTLPYPHPCTAGNKEEEYTVCVSCYAYPGFLWQTIDTLKLKLKKNSGLLSFVAL